MVIAILGILALFLVPSFMGYARDAKLEVMKANVRTGQSAYAYALTKYEDEKNEVTQKKLIGEEVCKNMNGIACYYFRLHILNHLPCFVFLPWNVHIYTHMKVIKICGLAQ